MRFLLFTCLQPQFSFAPLKFIQTVWLRGETSRAYYDEEYVKGTIWKYIAKFWLRV